MITVQQNDMNVALHYNNHCHAYIPQKVYFHDNNNHIEETKIIACISRYMNTVPDDKCTTNKTSQFSKFCLFGFSIAM